MPKAYELFAVRCPSRSPYQREAGLFEPLFVDKESKVYVQQINEKGRVVRMQHVGDIEDFCLYPSFVSGAIIDLQHPDSDSCDDNVIKMDFVLSQPRHIFASPKQKAYIAFRFSGMSVADGEHFDAMVIDTRKDMIEAIQVLREQKQRSLEESERN